MARYGTWWLPCVFSLFCACVLLSSVAAGTDGDELFIFNELCALKEEPGPCKALKQRFFFNIDTGRCGPFNYGGCGGNANNFRTLAACEETCVVSADKSPCHLPEAPGPCRGLVTRFLFDSASQECRLFYYGGCFGNANNFRSLAACQAKCQGHGKSTKAPEVVSEWPTKAAEIQLLKNHEEFALRPPQRHHVASSEEPAGESKEELSSRQVQVTLSAPEKTADFTPPAFCHAPIAKGMCNASQKRFAFNPELKKCQMFLFSGCGGNGNNFIQRRQCTRTCMNTRGRAPDHGARMIRIRKKNINSILFHSA